MRYLLLKFARRSLNIVEKHSNSCAAAVTRPFSNTELARTFVNTSHPTLNYLNKERPSVTLKSYSKYVKGRKIEEKKYKSDTEYHSSSESDNEALGHRGESDFWRRKMRTFHGILDVNKDGVISYDDFKLLGDRFVNTGHLNEKHKEEFHKVIKDLWENLWGEITPYNLVTVERYLEDMHHVLNDKALKKKVHSFLPFLFKAIDKDNNGKVTVEDFKLFFNCLGLKEVDAVFSFRTIDTNGDGKLTRKEFISHGRQFFLTEDPEDISKYFWGPLVE